MAYLAGMNGNRGCDPMAMAAMMNGGMGNGMWNNPFVYLVWMMFAGRFMGNGWDGNGCAQGNLTAQLDSLRNQMSDNQNTGLERGFANVAYEAQAQTCQLINAGNANTQRIIDVLNCHWQQELQQKYQDARLELSQQRQNAYLISQLKTTTTATA